MAKNKGVSKNDASTRKQDRKFFYDSKVVTPVEYIASGSAVMVASYEDGTLVKDKAGNVIVWSMIVNLNSESSNDSYFI